MNEREELTDEMARGLLVRRVESLDVAAAKNDIVPFLKDPSVVEVWSKKFFLDVVSRITLT